MAKYSYREIDICYMANGTKLSLPLHTFTGGAGPVVGLSAAIHGDEIIGVEILRRVVNILKDEDIQGTVKIMPVVNALAFEDTNRCTPIDRSNLNRVFPGVADGTITESIAYSFLEEFIYTLDILCDIHSGGNHGMVDYVYIQNDEGMSRAFGSKILYRPQVDYCGSVSGYAKQKGILAMTVEIGGQAIREEDVARGVQGVLNVLRYKGVLKGEVPMRDDQIVVTHIERVNPKHGGLMVPGLSVSDLGEILEGPVLLGSVYNPKTLELLEEVRAPYEQNLIILCRPSVNRVSPGGGSGCFMIGEMTTAEK